MKIKSNLKFLKGKNHNYLRIFFIFLILYSTNQYLNKSLFLMPSEYKLVKKIFDKISLKNDLGNSPVSIIIRAGEGMHYLMKDTGICKDEKNYCIYFENLDPFTKYKGYRSREVNYAIKQSYLHGHANASASPTGTILINRSTFRVLEGKEDFIAAAIAHEMFHIMQFSPFNASLKALKVWRDNPNKTDKEIKEVFLNKSQILEAEADAGAALMLFQADYPKDTFLKAMEYFYKTSGIIHTKGQSKRHPDYITRINLIKAFINDTSIKKDHLKNISGPLTWRYNRRENWLKFYPSKIKN